MSTTITELAERIQADDELNTGLHLLHLCLGVPHKISLVSRDEPTRAIFCFARVTETPTSRSITDILVIPAYSPEGVLNSFEEIKEEIKQCINELLELQFERMTDALKQLSTYRKN